MDPNTRRALKPSVGIPPNLVDPYIGQPNLMVTSVVCLTLITVCISIRSLTKAYLFMCLEDYFMIFAGVCIIPEFLNFLSYIAGDID
ncbi:predicted protein [Sclerotinia sclerotiorum 1980 UF-70]|uniref:Uncharacterized protein n=1 Tax=Sclerotinia sclerotiorum (strain ATCC 18683 / 1980 / Ss-1) TaxID=665079 RepID=A7EPT4_SCLS1|nr:predicted protein [Sclerotinia sclerotiorum 1980 UF-70]EDO04850.1 predicted protein [Sclerotinia sclerotiorum 1980 UF-70]